jgi:hypothetical protein
MSRRALLVIVAFASVVGTAGLAGATPILEIPDAEDLAASLAEATEVQGVCYGWDVYVTDQGSGPGGRDLGSSRGPGSDAQEAEGCDRYVVFTAQLVYTSASSESEDSASFGVQSNIAGAPTSGDLRRFGISGNGLLGNHDDAVLANAVLALPALVAEAGLAPPVELEPNTEALPAGDGATGSPASDWMRQHGWTFAALVCLVAAGIAWAGWVVGYLRPFRMRRPSGLPE